MQFTAHDELSLFYLLFSLGALLALAATRRIPVPLLLVCGGLVLGFIPGLPQVQLAPELFRTIKVAVDTDQRPGQFLLTGSAQILALRDLPDALPGRLEIIERPRSNCSTRPR